MGIETTITTFGGGDYSWLGSARGFDTPKTGTLDVSAFTIANGFIPAGTPLKLSSGKLIPADATSTRASLAGFLCHDQPATTTGADQPAAYVTDATVIAAKVPGTHDLTDGRYLADQQDDAT